MSLAQFQPPIVIKITKASDRLKPLNASKPLSKNHQFFGMTSRIKFDIMGDVSSAEGENNHQIQEET
jgi:hypothetical protein